MGLLRPPTHRGRRPVWFPVDLLTDSHKCPVAIQRNLFIPMMGSLSLRGQLGGLVARSGNTWISAPRRSAQWSVRLDTFAALASQLRSACAPEGGVAWKAPSTAWVLLISPFAYKRLLPP